MAYLKEENAVLRERLGGRVRLTDPERRIAAIRVLRRSRSSHRVVRKRSLFGVAAG